MLKRTLVATALAASFGASAASIDLINATYNSNDTNYDWTAVTTGYVYSVEGSNSLAGYAAPDALVDLGAAYQVGDLVTFTYNAKILTVGTVLATSEEDGTAAGVDEVLTPATANADGITLGFLSKTDNSVTYRVTDVTGTTSNLALIVDGFVLDDASVEALSDGVELSYSAQTNTGTPIDQGSSGSNTVEDIITLKDQLSARVVPSTGALDGVVNVSTVRKTLVGTTDTLSIDFVDNKANVIADAVVSKAVYTLNGDFSWIEDTNATSAGIQQPSGVVTVGSSAATITSITDDAIVFTQTGNANVVDFAVTFTPAVNLATGSSVVTATLPDTTYTLDYVLTYADSGTDGANTNQVTTLTDSKDELAAGAWTLNGKSSLIQAYPVGSNIEQFLWVTNSSSLPGAVTATAIAGGESYDLGVVGTAAAKSLTYVATAVNTALAAEGIDSGRVQLKLVVNSPEDNVDIYAGYKVTSDADRLNLTVKDL